MYRLLFGSKRRDQPAPALPEVRQRPQRRSEDRTPLQGWGNAFWGKRPLRQDLILICDRSAAGMGLILPQALPLGRVLTVIPDDGGAVFRGVIRHCRPEGGGYRMGLRELAWERREQERDVLNIDASLVWDDLFRGQIRLPALLRNLSQRGFQIEAPLAVPVPLVVCLMAECWQYYASTCYCHRSEEGYVTGAQLIVARPQS